MRNIISKIMRNIETLTRNQKIILSVFGSILIFVISGMIASSMAEYNFVKQSSNGIFDLPRTGAVWIICVVLIGALVWFLFGQNKK